MKVQRVVAAAVVTLVVLAGMAPAGAHESPEHRRREITRELGQLQSAVGEIAAEEADLVAELTVTRRSRAALDARVAELDATLAAARADVARSERTVELAVARHVAAQARVDRARAALDGARRDMREQAVTAFVQFGTEPTHLDVALDVTDIRHLHEMGVLLSAAGERQAATVARYQALEGNTAVLEAAADEAMAAATAQRDALTATKRAVEAARSEQARARAAVAAEAAHEEHLLQSARSKRDAYERRIAALQQESSEITALLRRRQSGQGRTISGKGVLASPIPGAVVTSAFGWRTHPIFGDRRLHTGIDFGASTGTPIRAAGDGVVVYAGWRGGYGNAIVIDHGGSLATLYAHQSRLAVGDGARVSRGQVIGAVGSTGYSTGPHLHFEVRVDGTPVDPMAYL